MMKRTKPPGAYVGSESKLQASAIRLVRSLLPGALVIHVPNGRNAGSARMGGFWNGQGVVSGVPDILVFKPSWDFIIDDWHNTRFLGLAIELKVWPGKPSIEQLAVHEKLREAGWRVEVCYSINEVERAVKTTYQHET